MFRKLIVVSGGAGLVVYSIYLAFFTKTSEVIYGSTLVCGLLSIVLASVIGGRSNGR